MQGAVGESRPLRQGEGKLASFPEGQRPAAPTGFVNPCCLKTSYRLGHSAYPQKGDFENDGVGATCQADCRRAAVCWFHVADHQKREIGRAGRGLRPARRRCDPSIRPRATGRT